MEVVSENKVDLSRQRALSEVSWALRDTASNLLRVIRGAGKPHEIGQQAQTLLQAFVSYQEITGMLPPAYELAEILSVERDPQVMGRLEGQALDRAYAEQRVIRGALQLAASRLISQSTQERAGEHEMYEGINAIGRIHEEMRRPPAQKAAGRAKSQRTTRSRQPKSPS